MQGSMPELGSSCGEKRNDCCNQDREITTNQLRKAVSCKQCTQKKRKKEGHGEQGRVNTKA